MKTDEINNLFVKLKTIGRHWFWRYEYRDFVIVEFDPYLIIRNEIDINIFRLLDVDNWEILPINAFIKIIIT